ncbi:hypothetical protein EJX00_02310 [Enterococcus faecium]|nr:hypothetical protein [Enterococcus faecium]
MRLGAKRQTHDLFLKWCSISCPSVLAQKRQNMRNYFSVCFSNTQDKTLILQPLINGVQSAVLRY